MTTQPKRRRKPNPHPDDERDPILDAADDVAQLFRSQDDDEDDRQTEAEEEELQPLDDPSWEESLRIRYGDKTDEEIVAFAQDGDSVALDFLNHVFVFLGRIDGAYAEGGNRDAAQFLPLGGENDVERVRDFLRVRGQRAVADAHLADLRERGLQGG